MVLREFAYRSTVLYYSTFAYLSIWVYTTSKASMSKIDTINLCLVGNVTRIYYSMISIEYLGKINKNPPPSYTSGACAE